MEYVMEALLTIILIILLIAFVVWLIGAIARWKLFTKAGEKGWKSLIPIYSQYIMCNIIGVCPWWIFIYLVVGSISGVAKFFAVLLAVVSTYYRILVSISLARSFGKSDGFGILLFFFPTICTCIIAYGNSSYLGVKPMNDFVFDSLLKTNKDDSNVNNTSTVDSTTSSDTTADISSVDSVTNSSVASNNTSSVDDVTNSSVVSNNTSSVDDVTSSSVASNNTSSVDDVTSSSDASNDTSSVDDVTNSPDASSDTSSVDASNE